MMNKHNSIINNPTLRPRSSSIVGRACLSDNRLTSANGDRGGSWPSPDQHNKTAFEKLSSQTKNNSTTSNPGTSKHNFFVSSKNNQCEHCQVNNMTLNILQWNIKGFFNNLDELNVLLKEHNPNLVSLQETHVPFGSSPIVPKSYKAYFTNIESNTTCKQGIGLLIKKNIPHKIRSINSNLQIICLELQLQTKFTYINIYIPPQQIIQTNDLNNIISQVDSPIIIGGDVNAWSTLWGSPITSNRGRIIEDFLLNSNVIILNDGSPTHLSTHNTFTHIDITCCSPDLFPAISWKTTTDLYNSDHYPIITSVAIGKSSKKIPPKPKIQNRFGRLVKISKQNSDLFIRKTTESQQQQRSSYTPKSYTSSCQRLYPPNQSFTQSKN